MAAIAIALAAWLFFATLDRLGFFCRSELDRLMLGRLGVGARMLLFASGQSRLAGALPILAVVARLLVRSFAFDRGEGLGRGRLVLVPRTGRGFLRFGDGRLTAVTGEAGRVVDRRAGQAEHDDGSHEGAKRHLADNVPHGSLVTRRPHRHGAVAHETFVLAAASKKPMRDLTPTRQLLWPWVARFAAARSIEDLRQHWTSSYAVEDIDPKLRTVLREHLSERVQVLVGNDPGRANAALREILYLPLRH